MLKRMISVYAALIFAVLTGLPAEAGEGMPEGKLLYEIQEHAVGTRSQGWRGTLYDQHGMPVKLAEGRSMQTPAGDVVGVVCTVPWKPCGAILQQMLKDGHAANIPMDEAWSYRITLTAPGSKSEGVHGTLMRAGRIVRPAPGEAEARTPMGPFVWVDSPYRWGSHGWFPAQR